MSTFEFLVLGGILVALFQLNELKQVLTAHRFDGDTGFSDDVLQKLSAIEDRLSEIEGHTGRVAELLYDQDEFDREHLVGKYAEPI